MRVWRGCPVEVLHGWRCPHRSGTPSENAETCRLRGERCCWGAQLVEKHEISRDRGLPGRYNFSLKIKSLPRGTAAQGNLTEWLLQRRFGTKQKKMRTCWVSPHLFVGVKLFVCLMSEPAIKRRRDVKTGKKKKINQDCCNTSNISFRCFADLMYIFF